MAGLQRGRAMLGSGGDEHDLFARSDYTDSVHDARIQQREFGYRLARNFLISASAMLP